MLRTSRSLGLLFLAIAAAAPLACDGGCGGSNGSGADAMASSSVAPLATSAASMSASGSASALKPKMTFRGATGALGQLLRGSIAIDGLSDDKKAAIEKIGSDLRKEVAHEGGHHDGGTTAMMGAVDGGANPRAEMKAMHDDLIAGVKAGKVDTAKMDAHHAALEKDAKARHEADDEALNKLYATLDAGERAKAVANVRAADEKRMERMKAHERDGGGGLGGGGGGADGGAGRDFQRMRLERYTKDLDLDADQQKKADALLPKEDPKAMADMRANAKKDQEAVLAAFEKDGFDAKKVDAFDAKKMRGPMDTELKFLTGLTGILKPAQRDRLAQKIERNGQGRRPGGGHGGGNGGDRDREDEEEPIDWE